MALAAEGAAVVVNDYGGSAAGVGSDAGPAEAVAAEIRARGGKAAANTENVADYQAAERIIKQALDEFGRLDILVNNAGILRDRMVFNMSEDEWDAVIAVHLKGTFNTIRHASVLFRQQRSGRIINTSSESGLGNAGQANYSAAKEGIVGLTRTVARDLGRYGVTCNAIRPRAATRLTISPEMEAARQAALARGKRREVGGGAMAAMDPASVAALVVFLASDQAQNVNGRDFLIWGNEVGLYSQPVIEAHAFARGEAWTPDEMFEIFPRTIGRLLRNAFQPREEPAQG